MEKTVILVRHGETEWNDEDRVQGWASVSLNETGERQAKQVGRYLTTNHPEIRAIHSLDLMRAVETTARIRQFEPFEEVPVSFSDRWRERDFGVFQGFDSRTLFSRFPEYAISELGMVAAGCKPEQGESYFEFDSRVVDSWVTFLENLDTRKTLLVTHSGVIRQIIAHVLGYDVVRAIEEIEVGNCCITTISTSGGGEREVLSENVDNFLN